jgi:hypothetical protein
MMHIALELAKENPTYGASPPEFFQHYTFIGKAMKNIEGRFQLWDDRQGFFYDTLRYQW